MAAIMAIVPIVAMQSPEANGVKQSLQYQKEQAGRIGKKKIQGGGANEEVVLKQSIIS